MHPCGQFRSNHLGTDYVTETELAARSLACLPVGSPLSIKDLTRGPEGNLCSHRFLYNCIPLFENLPILPTGE